MGKFLHFLSTFIIFVQNVKCFWQTLWYPNGMVCLTSSIVIIMFAWHKLCLSAISFWSSTKQMSLVRLPGRVWINDNNQCIVTSGNLPQVIRAKVLIDCHYLIMSLKRIFALIRLDRPTRRLSRRLATQSFVKYFCSFCRCTNVLSMYFRQVKIYLVTIKLNLMRTRYKCHIYWTLV